MFADDPEHCVKCGHGECSTIVYGRRPTRRRRLPEDLGALQREGRRPDPHLENVVRFDRLRGPFLREVPPAGPVEVSPVTVLREMLAGDDWWDVAA